MGRQHMIDSARPPITDRMWDGAEGASDVAEVIGARVQIVYEAPDSDRGEVLILFDNGYVLAISTDPGYDREGVHRTPDRWEVVLYNASETAAAAALRRLKPGHWL